MIVTLSRLYDDCAHARAVVDELKAAGMPAGDIGIIASSRGARHANAAVDRDVDDEHAHSINRSAGIGAALGGAAGLLAGLGAFVLPGVGAVVAAGWLASALAGAVAGGAAGGVVGALIEAGVNEDDAAGYAEGVRRGGTLVTIKVAPEDRELFEDILTGRDTHRLEGEFDPAAMPAELRGLDAFELKRP
jgi:hypothetical protein